jgi:hypothetical protein
MSQLFQQPPLTPIGPLPPHKKYQVESSGLQYRMFCSYTLSPSREFGVAGDLYVVAEPALLFYKENTTSDRRGKWRLASDDFLIHHPYEFSHRLIVTRKGYIQWSTHRAKAADFEDAIPAMATRILSRFRGRTQDNPIEID